MKSLWDEIQEANANREGKCKAPLAKIDLDKLLVGIKQCDQPLPNQVKFPHSRNFHLLWEATRVEMT